MNTHTANMQCGLQWLHWITLIYSVITVMVNTRTMSELQKLHDDHFELHLIWNNYKNAIIEYINNVFIKIIFLVNGLYSKFHPTWYPPIKQLMNPEPNTAHVDFLTSTVSQKSVVYSLFPIIITTERSATYIPTSMPPCSHHFSTDFIPPQSGNVLLAVRAW